MKWFNHQIITGSTVYVLFNDPVGTAIAMSGSIFPDYIEGNDYESTRWKKNHRRLSHWGGAYFFLWLVFFFWTQYREFLPFYKSFSQFSVFSIHTLTPYIVSGMMYFFLGCFFHVLEDSLCGKVSFLNPYRRDFGIKLFRVGSLKEYCCALSVVGVVVCIEYLMRR